MRIWRSVTGGWPSSTSPAAASRCLHQRPTATVFRTWRSATAEGSTTSRKSVRIWCCPVTASAPAAIRRSYCAPIWSGVRNSSSVYAFALWDSHTEELLLVRNRLGIKPLSRRRRVPHGNGAVRQCQRAGAHHRPGRLRPDRHGGGLSTTACGLALLTSLLSGVGCPPGQWLEVLGAAEAHDVVGTTPPVRGLDAGLDGAQRVVVRAAADYCFARVVEAGGGPFPDIADHAADAERTAVG